MKKHANKTTLAVKTIKIIRSGATWQEVSELLDYSIVYLQRLCKTHFKRPENYRKLLELAQSNKKAKKEAKNVVDDEVIVIETGAIISKGWQWIVSQDIKIFMPLFCISEIEKISERNPRAEEVLLGLYRTNIVNLIRMTRKQETLLSEPKWCPKDRSIGVVSLCCRLWTEGKHLRLVTTSNEIQSLALSQGMDHLFVEKMERLV